jgi:hypothetical protein
VGSFEKCFKIFEGPVIRVQFHVVCNIVSIVAEWRRIKGEKPQGGNAKPLEIIELFSQALKIADAVIITIAKGSHMELVNDRILIP